MLYLDLDRFKVVNDSLGHLVGDELLIAVSRRLESCLRPGDALARLGGDEFAILLNELGDEQQANAIAFRIQEALSAPFSIGGREVFTSASIGIAFGRSAVQQPRRDHARRRHRDVSREGARQGAARGVRRRHARARARSPRPRKRPAPRRRPANDFEVHYQPIVLARHSGMCVGFESLVRWTRNGEAGVAGDVHPDRRGAGAHRAARHVGAAAGVPTFADWQRRFPTAGLDYITVNVSSRQLMQQNFLRIVEQAVEKAGLKPCDLRLEITETALMDSPNEAARGACASCASSA